jgi:hypothetical protein
MAVAAFAGPSRMIAIRLFVGHLIPRLAVHLWIDRRLIRAREATPVAIAQVSSVSS